MIKRLGGATDIERSFNEAKYTGYAYDLVIDRMKSRFLRTCFL